MPTGYTFRVVDGEITEFPKFAAACARAFGALILLRDDPPTETLPESPGNEGDYEERALTRDEARLVELLNMTEEDATTAATEEHKATLASVRAYAAKCSEENARLERMAEKVTAWDPPSADHANLKEFMLQQLDISKSSGTLYDYVPDQPKSGAKWKSETEARLRQGIVDSKVRVAEKVERDAGRKLWLEQLRESLNSYQESQDE